VRTVQRFAIVPKGLLLITVPRGATFLNVISEGSLTWILVEVETDNPIETRNVLIVDDYEVNQSISEGYRYVGTTQARHHIFVLETGGVVTLPDHE
jgi:hypothetical protein